jgi:hypothetical protein
MPVQKFKMQSGLSGFEDDILATYEDKISSHYHDSSDKQDIRKKKQVGGFDSASSSTNLSNIKPPSSYSSSTTEPDTAPCFRRSDSTTCSTNSNKNSRGKSDSINSSTFSSTDFTFSSSANKNNNQGNKTYENNKSYKNNKFNRSHNKNNELSVTSTDFSFSSSMSGGQSESNEGLKLATLQDDYIPRIFNLPSNSGDILDSPVQAVFENNVPFPQFTLGFQHFIHQSKNNFQRVNTFAGQRKPYLVLNKFERQIDDYDTSIEDLSKVYFKLDDKPIIDRSFYEFWEMIFTMNLINNEAKDFVSAHIGSVSGAAMQATLAYRDKYCSKNNCKDDSHVTQSTDPAIAAYLKDKPQRVYNSQVPEGNDAKLATLKDAKGFIKYFKDTTKTSANLVTSSTVLDWTDKNLQEQDITPVFVASIYIAFNILSKGGNFVCKINETFTDVSSKLLNVLASSFTSVTIVKPLTTRKSSSTKYVVCLGFKEDNKNKIIKAVEEIIVGFETNLGKGRSLNDIFPSYKIPQEFRVALINANIEITNRQFQAINEIISFIEEQNFRGEEYIKHRAMQIAATKFWVNLVYPIPEKIKEQIKEIKALKDEIVEVNQGKANVLNKKVLF